MSSSAAHTPLLYEHTDDSDHPEGGACIRVFRDEGPTERLERYSDEYTSALANLFVSTDGEPSGWQFAAPAVFLAHHACELSLKVRWLRSNEAVSVDDRKFRTHDLRVIVREIDESGGWDELSADTRVELDQEIGQLRGVTKDGISIRYATISENWCCLSLGALMDLVFRVREIAGIHAAQTDAIDESAPGS